MLEAKRQHLTLQKNIEKQSANSKARFDWTPTPLSTSRVAHFFLAKRPNFFSLSFLVELGSGGGGEGVKGAGRVWALASGGPGGSAVGC